MIRDVTEFRRTGVASRLVTELDIPVAAWRAAMCHAGRRDGVRVRTFLIPLHLVEPDDPLDQLVLAVRTDPPPHLAVQNQGLLRWWRVGDLTVPLGRWRAALHRAARQKDAHVQTFLVPPRARRVDDPDQLVYVVWGDGIEPRRTRHPCPVERPLNLHLPIRAVTDLDRYRADRLGRASSFTQHPSNFADRRESDHSEGDNGDDVEDVDADR